jgi:hypothetical protein
MGVGEKVSQKAQILSLTRQNTALANKNRVLVATLLLLKKQIVLIADNIDVSESHRVVYHKGGNERIK